MASPSSQPHLRRLLVLLLAVAMLITLAGGLLAGYSVLRDTLVANALESNRVYAAKIAAGVATEADTAHRLLELSARNLGRRWDQKTQDQEVERLKEQSETFNSVIVVDGQGILRAYHPMRPNMLHRRMTTLGMVEALKARRPLVSPPFHAHSGHYIVLVSQPVWDQKGRYLGFVAGTIYLDSVNTLGRLVAQHFYHDGSYLYAVDRAGTIIYHQDARRVGANVARNGVVARLMGGENGAMAVVNTRGEVMLTGYAVVPELGWGIVSQQPAPVVLDQVRDLTTSLFLRAMPFYLLALCLGWLLARHFTRPLNQLAEVAAGLDHPEAPEQLDRVRAWYREARQIKQGLQVGLRSVQLQLRFLYQESTTDPLTGLMNRRGIHRQLEIWEANRIPFAALALDVDHFKQVNDRHGHPVGDKVLRHLATLMDRACREQDLTCRAGGEEFLILLPDCPLPRAREVADRLRQNIQESPNPAGESITVSIGVAHYPTHGDSAEETLQAADRALYLAKERGRNRVETP